MSLADAKQISVDAGRRFHSKRTKSGAENFSPVEKDAFTLDWFAEDRRVVTCVWCRQAAANWLNWC